MNHSGCNLVLMLLSLFPGLWALPTPRQASRATSAQVATVLHSKVQHLLQEYVRDQLQGVMLMGTHTLPSLPVLAGSATDLESVQADTSLPIIHSYLRVYAAHLKWLRGTKLVAQTNLAPKITEVLKLLHNLASRLEDEMQKMNLSWDGPSSFSISESKEWSTLRAGFVILRDLRSFLLKTAHELLALNPEW